MSSNTSLRRSPAGHPTYSPVFRRRKQRSVRLIKTGDQLFHLVWGLLEAKNPQVGIDANLRHELEQVRLSLMAAAEPHIVNPAHVFSGIDWSGDGGFAETTSVAVLEFVSQLGHEVAHGYRQTGVDRTAVLIIYVLAQGCRPKDRLFRFGPRSLVTSTPVCRRRYGVEVSVELPWPPREPWSNGT
jgi:hypothetical protein